MKSLLLVAFVALAVALITRDASADPEADMAAGDLAWAARAEGADDLGNARPEPVAAAIEAYERAVKAAPQRLDAHWKRVRALFFAGEFASRDDAASAAWFERARDAGLEGIAALDAAVASDPRPSKVAPGAIAARVPEALHDDVAALHMWSSIAWGAWTRYNSVFAIVRSGVPGKLKRQAEIVLALEPALEQGGAYRLLAALHRSLPRVPLYTGWVDRAQAFVLLDQAMVIAPDYPGNRLLYALTILELAPERRSEAIALLEQVASIEPDPAERVEQLAMRAGARELLEEEKAGADER